MPRGRPRDETIDAAVLTATRELLAEKGFEATTIQAIGDRAGVHASAIYRRWPSRVRLIEQAVFPGLQPVAVRPSGDLRKDLRKFVRAYVAILGSPAARAGAPGLLASYRADNPADPSAWAAVSTRPLFAAILAAAADEVDPAVDPDDVFDLLLGGILARSVVPTVAARRRPAETLVDLTVRMLRPW